MKALVRFSLARPKTVVAAWLVLVAACLPLMAGLTGALKAAGFDNPRGEATVAQHTLERAFDEVPENLQVVLTRPGGDVTGVLPQATAVARATPYVTTVEDFKQNAEWLSADRHTTFLQLGFRADRSTIQNQIADLRTRLAAALGPTGVQAHVTGAQALDFDLSEQSGRDAVTAELIAFPLLIIVLFLVFRSVAAMLLPVVLAGVALVVTSAAGFLLTYATDLSTLFTNAVSIIGLAVAVDYSLFIIKRYRDEIAGGEVYDAALRTAMRTAGHAVLFSGLAVVVALLALFIPRITVFSSMATAGVLVTLVALAMSMTLLPAALKLLGRRIDWLSLRPRAGRSRRLPGSAIPYGRTRPAITLVLLLGLFVLLAAPMTGIRLQSPVASATILPADADSRLGIERMQSALEFRTLFPVQIVLSTPADAPAAGLLAGVQRASALVRTQPRIGQVTDVAALALPAAARVTPLWAERDGLRVSRVVVTPAADPDSDAAHDLVHTLRDRLPAVVPDGVTVRVTGATAVGVDVDDVLVRTLPAVLGAVALVTMLLLARAFRSWLLPLLALALNALVVAASLGLLTLISQRALGQRIDSTMPALVFAIMFGLSMDYMVIMISRMREHHLADGDHGRAVRDGLRDTAGLVNGAALIMVAVFTSFLVAEISLVQQLGLSLAIAVVLDAVVVRLLLMPAALHLIGPRVWGRAARPVPVEARGPAVPALRQ